MIVIKIEAMWYFKTKCNVYMYCDERVKTEAKSPLFTNKCSSYFEVSEVK